VVGWGAAEATIRVELLTTGVRMEEMKRTELMMLQP